jgi:hypothetical protein
MPITHGMSQTKAYLAWTGMKKRCLWKGYENSKDYSERGISICDRWHKFEEFYLDMGDPPQGLTLERIDNNKGYFLDNCKWATRQEQANNRRKGVVKVTAFGKTLNITEWSAQSGVKLTTLLARITKYGYSPEEAIQGGLYEKRRLGKITLVVNGKTLTLIQWAQETGIKIATIRSRLKRGWTPEKIISGGTNGNN